MYPYKDRGAWRKSHRMKAVLESQDMHLSKDAFEKAWEALKQEYDLWGPTIKKGEGIYADTDICVYDKLDSFKQLCWTKRTHFSAKELAFHIIEELFHITKKGPQETCKPFRKKIVFCRSCDIEGFRRLDKIYLENGPFVDIYYKRLRDTMSFFLIECSEGFEGCFCQSVTSDTTTAYAVSLFETGDEISVTIGEPDFAKWFGLTKNKTEETQPKGFRGIQAPVAFPDLNNKALFDSPLWIEYARRCIGCGRCNIVCPACSCFNVSDMTDEKGHCIRQRSWASCQIDGFAKTAGGHEYRTDKGQRQRYRLLHKFHNYKERFGAFMCVGCGRCIEACPEYIDIRGTLERLSHGQSVRA